MTTDASKRVFYNSITRDAFIETNCDNCYFPARAMHRIDPSKPDCPHLERAAENKLPKEWSRRRNAVMGETYRCSDRLVQPPVNRRKKAPADTVPMFTPDVVEIDFVPVEGWPDAESFGRKTKSKDDHA